MLNSHRRLNQASISGAISRYSLAVRNGMVTVSRSARSFSSSSRDLALAVASVSNKSIWIAGTFCIAPNRAVRRRRRCWSRHGGRAANPHHHRGPNPIVTLAALDRGHILARDGL